MTCEANPNPNPHPPPNPNPNNQVPMTCENFITLCDRNYYRGLPFHRVIKNFMLQVTTL